MHEAIPTAPDAGRNAVPATPGRDVASRVPNRFEDLVDGLDAVVWEMDVDTFRFTYVNQRAQHVFGYPAQRWLDEPTFWQDVLLHPEDRDWALDFCQSATRQARDHVFEYRAIRADGETVWLRDLVRVVSDAGGAARSLRGVMIDISREKQVVAELREREAQLAEAQRVAHLGSWEFDVATGTLSWSDEAYRLCGLEPQSVTLTNEAFLALVHPEDRDTVQTVIASALQHGEPYCIRGRIQRADGTVRHAQMRGEAVTDRHGRVVRLRGTGQDITELVRAETALRASEESYRTIFQNSSDAIWLHDLETGEMLDVNQAGCEMFGYSFEEMMAAGHDALLYPGSAYTAERVREYMAQAAAGETPRFEWMGRHKDGSAVWGEITLRRVGIGGKDHILASVRDVTQRKAAEDARRAAEQDARTMASRMRAVAGAAAGLIGVDSLQALLPVLRDACQEVISLDAFWLSLYNEADHSFAYVGYDLGELVPTQTVSATGTLSERVRQRRKSIITHRSTDPEAAGGILLGTQRRSESIIRTPILSGQRVLGVISVQSYTPDLYTEQDVEVLETIAALAASALLNVELLAELRASEESYRTLFEASGDAIYVLDKDTGAILDVNRAACELNGFPPEEMKALGIGGLSYDRPPHNWEDAQELIRRAAAGEPQRVDWLARHSSGRDVWGEVTLQRVNILGEDRVLATARDITERRSAEEARRQAEQDAQAMASRMRAVAAAAAGVIGAESVDALQVVLREECRRVMPFDAFTMALYDVAEHTLAYLEGFDAEIRVPARTIPAAGTPGERVILSRRSLLTRRSDEPEAAGARPMGTGRRSESIIRTPILSGDRVLGLLSVQSYAPELYTEQDVEVLEAIASLAATALLNLELLAQREAAAVALSQSETKFKALFENSPDAIFLMDGEVFVDCNHAALELMRCTSKDQILGQRPGELSPELQPDGTSSFGPAGAITRRAIAEGNVVFEWLAKRADGDTFPAEVSATAFPLEDRQLLHVVARDITARKHAEQALLRANQELEQRVAERTAELAATNAALEEEIAEREVARAELQQRTEELEAIFQALPDLYFRLAADGTVMEYRSGSEEGLYLAPEEFLGRRLPELLPADVGDLVRGALDEVEQTRRLVCVEYPLSFNGCTCEYEARLLPLEDGSLISIIRNITDRKRAERELQHREEHFRSLIENGSDLIVVVDADGITRYMSPSARRVIGWAPEERIGQHSFDLIHPLDRARVGDRRTEALNNPGTTVPVEFRYRHRSGEWVVLDGLIKTIRQDSGEDGVVLSARDITERKEFEEQLRRREEHFRRLIENAHDLVQVLDTNGTTLYISPSVQRLTGYTPEELIGQNMSVLAHPSEVDIGTAKLAETAANPGAIIRGEFRIVHKDGSVRVMETFGRTLSPTSADEGIVVNARDITERYAAEEALRRSEEHFRRLIENAHDLVMVIDASAQIEYASPSVERILGFSPDELVGMPGFALVHPEDVEIGQQGLGQTLEVPGSVTVTELRLHHKDGGYRRVESLARTLSSDTAQAGIVINVRDITEHYQAEQALRDSEARYRSLIENAHDIVTILDLDGRIRYQSPQVERVLGYQPAEMIGQSALDFVHPEDLAIPSQALEEILAAPGATYFNEYRFRHKDGTWRYLETFGRTLVPESPAQGLVFNTRDVTERREAQRALQEREEHFRRLIEKSGDMIQLLDAAGKITYTGPSVERLLGYAPEEIQGTDALSYIHPDDLQATTAALMRMLATPEEVQTAEYRVRHKAGHYRMFEAFARTVFEASGEQVVVVNARDVTERKQAEAELKRQRAYFEQLLASVDAGIAAWNAEGRFEYVSPNAVEDPEIREWIVGKTHHEYCARRGLPPELAELRWAAVMQAIETRTQTEYEETVRRRDGTDVHFLRRSRPILNGAGELERVIGYSVDITERKRTEEAVRRATAEAEQARETAERANRAKSEFLSRMSHELRTPMNSILGFAQLLERAPLPAEHKKGVGHILKAGRHLLQLINEVLEISRIEAGRHSLSLEPVRVGVVLQEALDLVRPLANQWGVSLEEGPWAHGNVFVQADRQRLAQVLLNLLSNAIKYNRPGGRVRLDCGVTRGTDSTARLWIRIEDTGRGIPPERVDQLFTPFARLGAEQTGVEGTGLGLALSQRLSEAMGGTLSLERTSEAGSVFRLELLITKDPVQQLDGQAEPLQVLEGVPHAPATLLYIEDNLANLSLVETILLSRPRWRTVPALQGQLGLELAREHQPDLILLDLHLPDIPGIDVLRRLRGDDRTAQIPVVVISADATPSAIERLRAVGADAYLTKPLEIDEFLQTLERFLPEPEAHHDPE